MGASSFCVAGTPSVSHSLDSSLIEGASGEEIKLCVLPKPPSQRKTLPGRGEMSRKRQSGEQWHGGSHDGRSFYTPPPYL